MKILFCNYEYPPLGGGGGVVMAALARALARRHSVTVLTSGALGLPAESDDAGARIVRAPVFFRRELATANLPSMLAYLPMGALRGMRLGRGAGFDVINTHFVVPSGPLGDFLARLHRVPNVLSVHGGDLYDPSKASSPHRHAWLRRPIRYLLMRADALVGQSRNTLQNVRDIYQVQRDAQLIPLGIDRPPALDPAQRRALGLPEDAFLMVTVGRVVPRKATTQLVQALTAGQRAAVHLVIIGDGPDAAAVRRAAAEAGVAERVHWLGQVSDEKKYQVLSVADIFVSASQHEGFGLVFLEAMAFGLPVVCYDHGGQTDFLVNGETGYVLPLNDLGLFTQAIRNLYDRPEERRRMAERNRRLVEEFFIDTCAKRYETVFEEAVRGFAAHRGAA
ncbi:MAG: glycosyltransferase family 4 protein [Steroidobacteraceae bacterium]